MLIDKVIKPIFKPDTDKVRHLLKAISWRTIGTIDTMILGWIISGNPMTGVKIGAVEVFTKIFLYYAHERVWFRINFGIQRPRKTISEIAWAPSMDAYTQAAFLQDENGDVRKRAKVLINKQGEYKVVLTSYNSKTKERYSDIITGTKEEIENTLKIKL